MRRRRGLGRVGTSVARRVVALGEYGRGGQHRSGAGRLKQSCFCHRQILPWLSMVEVRQHPARDLARRASSRPSLPVALSKIFSATCTSRRHPGYAMRMAAFNQRLTILVSLVQTGGLGSCLRSKTPSRPVQAAFVLQSPRVTNPLKMVRLRVANPGASMQRSSFDFDVITGPVPPRPAPKPAPQPNPVQTAPPPPTQPGK